MLIPIGSDQDTVRRMPWVTLGILALCVLAFVATIAAPGDGEAISAAQRQAVEYYLAHPYLELDPQLKGHLYFTLRQSSAEVPRPADEDRIRREQTELDGLVEAYYEARRRMPFWRWGVIPADVEPAALVTHTFLHAGVLHLLGNLFILYLVGPAMEDAWGRPLFAVFYFLSGAVAALAFVARHPNLVEPLVGASGAIAGVMGAFAVRYWDSRITFYYFVWMIRIYQGTFSAPAWLMLGLWAVGELMFSLGIWAFFTLADLGDIGFLAHFGGFVFGVAAAWVVALLGLESRWVEPAVERHETVHAAREVEEALALARQGHGDEALGRLEGMLRRDPADTDAAAALWVTAVRAGATDRAAPALVPALAAAARADHPDLPAQLWVELIRTNPRVEVDLRTVARIAELLMREGLDGDVEETLRWVSSRVDRSTPAGLLVRFARLADRLGVTAPFAELALAEPDLDPALVAELQSFSA